MATASGTSIERELAALLGPDRVLPGNSRAYLSDATESRNLRGRADAVALPADAEQVAETVAWCYEHDVPIVPRGGGTGFTGGAVPLDGGVVLSLERLTKVRHLDPGLWRAAIEAGAITADRSPARARERALLSTRPRVLRAVPAGRQHRHQRWRPARFQVRRHRRLDQRVSSSCSPPASWSASEARSARTWPGYDLKSLMIGSEGTLGVVTAAWIKLIPAPEAIAAAGGAVHAMSAAGCEAIEYMLGSGIVPAAIEYLDGGGDCRDSRCVPDRPARRRAVHGHRRRRRQRRGGQARSMPSWPR